MKLTRQENRELNAILDKLVKVEYVLKYDDRKAEGPNAVNSRIELRDASIALADFINRKGRRLSW